MRLLHMSCRPFCHGPLVTSCRTRSVPRAHAMFVSRQARPSFATAPMRKSERPVPIVLRSSAESDDYGAGHCHNVLHTKWKKVVSV